jgi:hypothetical protein
MKSGICIPLLYMANTNAADSLHELETSDSSRFPRGVAPAILLDQIRNTVPFIFEGSAPPSRPSFRYLQVILGRKREVDSRVLAELSHAEYFELCLSAHHTTVASFVPTDVDNQIRFRLWHPGLPLETLREMAAIVERSYEWDHSPVSTRSLPVDSSGWQLSGHKGEWLSTAAAAYGALRRKDGDAAAHIAGMIVRELQREAEAYSQARADRQGLNLLKAATLIAHNLGDLDRVIDLWKLPEGDPLRDATYKAGIEGSSRFGGALVAAGLLNKAYMAVENHRHFALRTPKCLRVSSDLLLPIGPFFDSWGEKVAKHPALEPGQVAEVAEALVLGWERLGGASKDPGSAPVGYVRALAGMLEAFPGGLSRLSQSLPAKTTRILKAGTLRALLSVSRKRFEDQWAHMALNFKPNRNLT